MATVEELKLAIKAEVADAVGKLKQFERQAKTTNGAIGSLKSSFADMRDIMQGPIAAAGMVAKGFTEITKAGAELYSTFADNEKQQLMLNKAMADADQLSFGAASRISKYAKELENSTGIDDKKTKALATQLAAMGRTEDQINQIIQASANYSSVTGKDMVEAGIQLNKTFSGLAGELGEANSKIRGLTQDQLKNGEAVKIMNEQYKGQAELIGGSAFGASEKLTRSMESLKEAMGGAISTSFKPLVQNIAQAASDAAKAISSQTNIVNVLSGADKSYESISQAIIDITLQLQESKNGTDSLGKSTMILQSQYDKLYKMQEQAIRSQSASVVKSEQEKEQARIQSLATESASADKSKKIAEAEAKSTQELWDRIYASREETQSVLNKQQDTAIQTAIRRSELEAKAYDNIQFTTEATDEYTESVKNAEAATVSLGSVTGTVWDNLTEDTRKSIEATIEHQRLLKSIADTAVDGYAAMASAFGAAVVSGEEGWKAFGRAGLNAVAAVIEAMAAQAEIMAGEALLQVLSGNVAMIPALAQSATAITAAYAAAGAVRAIPLKEGGIVPATPGGTIARIAEGGQDEAVIPLNKIDDIFDKLNKDNKQDVNKSKIRNEKDILSKLDGIIFGFSEEIKNKKDNPEHKKVKDIVNPKQNDNAKNDNKKVNTYKKENILLNMPEMLTEKNRVIDSEKTEKHIARIDDIAKTNKDKMVIKRIVPLKDGGIIPATPGGTLARIGEGGKPEAVIPLDKMGNTGGITIVQYIAGSILAERQVKAMALSAVGRASRGY